MRLLYLFIVVLMISCKTSIKINEDKNCILLYEQAKDKLNEFYLSNSDSCLRLSLDYTEKALLKCSNFKLQFSDLKIKLLLLLHEYEKGYKFVCLMNDSDFTKSYKRRLYLNTFKALYFETQKNKQKRDSCFNRIELEIKNYLIKYPNDKDAITDLFFIKIKHIDKKSIINEIEFMKEKDKENEDFFKALKETILNIPEKI